MLLKWNLLLNGRILRRVIRGRREGVLLRWLMRFELASWFAYNRRKTSWKERAMSVERPCVLVGVTGCIAAYKAGEIVRGLQKAGVSIP